jgi:two-component system, NtrC family, sensor kinase
VISASNGREAFAILSAQDAPQLALLDWMMPEMEGPEVCSMVRTTTGCPFIYMIVLTSKTEKNNVAQALESGADDFLAKPVDADELRSRLGVGARAVKYERTLAEKNEQLDAYATEMEGLAEERAKQLVHAERLSTLGSLTAGIAHEMANPLMAITGNLSLLNMDCASVRTSMQDTEKDSLEKQEHLHPLMQKIPARLRDITAASDRLLQLLQNLKGYSRKDHDWISCCSIDQCIENALSLGSHRLKHGIAVEKDLGGALPSVSANPQQLEQVFLNLFVNASDAMSDQGGGTLRIASSHAGENLVVTIEDTGCGIPEDKLQTIWEPFFTTKDADKGTGLGLSISRGIIEDHKGSIRAENKPEGGTRFIIELPVPSGQEQ